ncbi:type IV pilus modification protein PilV [Rhodoferax sp. GW822-FHT02A01]|uniref:type IV pilus modification protein PilV n=1 Tax=Rhodoferax sp. GW822-FHT02A01 TaxID=3141537 RepID=UPI00315DAA6F
MKEAQHSQSGMMLIEALIAILLFAVGILGIVGLQGTAVKQVTEARFRSEASMLANQLLGQMWMSDRQSTSLFNNFTAGGAVHDKYDAWKALVTSTLPTPQDPTVSVNNTANDPGEGTVTITLFWRSPSDPSDTNDPHYVAPHRYVAIAQIKP